MVIMFNFKIIFIIFIFIYIASFSKLFSQSYINYYPLNKIGILNIRIADWLNDYKSACTFTFDDSDITHFEIANILDDYNFKGSFYINPNRGDWDNLKGMYQQLIKNGHEIGNHTYNHANLSKIQIDSIIYEISSGKKYIIEYLEVNPTSFTHPHSRTSEFIDSVLFSEHLFSRVSSNYAGKRLLYRNETMANRLVYGIGEKSDVEKTKEIILNSINEKIWLIFLGHGMGKSKYQPISSEFLTNLCKFIKDKENDIWIGTLSEIALYEHLKNEIILNIDINGNVVDIDITNIDKKYLIMNKLPITLKIKTDNKKIIIEKNTKYDIKFDNIENNYLITFNLKEIQNLSFRVE